MYCIVCNSRQKRYLFDGKDRMFGLSGIFREYQCLHCGLINIEPKPTNKQLKKYYPSTNYYSYNIARTQSFFGTLRSYLIAHLYNPTVLSYFLGIFLKVPALPSQATGKILDLGCGAGDTLMLLKEVGWDVYGMDIDANAIKVAHARGLKNVSLGAYEDMKKYRNNYFDVIRLYHVIEHLNDPADFFALAYTKLKPGGELILGTPNGASLIARLAKQYWYNLDAPRHLFIFSPKTLTTLARKAKFKKCIVEFSSAGGWIGSVQYVIGEWTGKPIDLINRAWLVMLVYPFEWLLDLLKLGDVFILRVQKT
jgi:2-polyprenyl-3-methyl-5-hydroxy-6-metoxy-1,4-benzoquinol methylase